MEKIDLIKFLNEILKPLSYKKNNNIWSFDNGVLIKRIELQKSHFGNMYYLNYGINFKGLDYKDVKTHVFRRLAASNKNENQEINSLLDLDKKIPEIERKGKLQFYVNDKIINYLNRMNTEEDVKLDLKDSPYLDMVTNKCKEIFAIAVISELLPRACSHKCSKPTPQGPLRETLRRLKT